MMHGLRGSTPRAGFLAAWAFGALIGVWGGHAVAADAAPAAAKSASAPGALPKGLDPMGAERAFPSTYRPLPAQPTAIVGATILTAHGEEIENGTLLLRDGKVVAVGRAIAVPEGFVTINAQGKWVSPGLIDVHSHLGVFSNFGNGALSNGNEATDPNTAQVWVENSVWPQDPGFNRARAGGVTSLQILPGSANLFGGRSVVLKNVPATTTQEMKFPDAPYGLKMACGENPRRVYGGRGRAPSTSMANVAGYRKAWIDAADYARRWDDYRTKVARGDKLDPPKRDLALDTLAGVLRGEILVQNHCYRAEEMATMIDIAKEFGFRITAFHHGVEAYKVAPLLAKEGICTATWGTWGMFKMESFDGIPENAALLESAGACAVIHSDDRYLIQRLNQEAAVAMTAGNRVGIKVNRAQAIKWITANPARMLGIADRTGTLEPGKAADVVIWSHDPFSIYAVAEQVFVDGALVMDARSPARQAQSDFEISAQRRGVSK